jgi:hypothetical protein
LAAVKEPQALYPELPWPQLIAGQARLALGDTQGALGDLLTSLGTNPFDPSVHCSLVETYQRLPVSPAWSVEKRARALRHCRELNP